MKTRSYTMIVLIILFCAFLWFEARPAAIRSYCQYEYDEKYQAVIGKNVNNRIMDDLTRTIYGPEALQEAKQAYNTCIRRWGLGK